MVISSSLGLNILPLIHDAPQLYAIYVIDENKTEYEQWAKN
jgi:hypothetical protein